MLPPFADQEHFISNYGNAGWMNGWEGGENGYKGLFDQEVVFSFG